jgi:1,4-alpha-glucan branching enzyme
MLYAWNENFVLPLSHDEVVHGKGSLLHKMPGDFWQQFANLRLLYGHMYAQPGKKLLFMGGEFAQRNEWYHATSLDWDLLQHAPHQGVQAWVRDLNHLYRQQPALHRGDTHPGGFDWVDCRDWEHCVVSLLRTQPGEAGAPRFEDCVVAVFNFTPVVREAYRVGVPRGGRFTERLNSDADVYGGSGVGNGGAVEAEPTPWHDRPFSLSLTLPPLGVLFLQPA